MSSIFEEVLCLLEEVYTLISSQVSSVCQQVGIQGASWHQSLLKQVRSKVPSLSHDVSRQISNLKSSRKVPKSTVNALRTNIKLSSKWGPPFFRASRESSTSVRWSHTSFTTSATPFSQSPNKVSIGSEQIPSQVSTLVEQRRVIKKAEIVD